MYSMLRGGAVCFAGVAYFWACVAMAQIAPGERLGRPAQAFSDDRRFGQEILTVLAPLHKLREKLGWAVDRTLDETACVGPMGAVIGYSAKTAMHQRFGEKLPVYAKLDKIDREWVAIETAAVLDLTSSAKIRADESLGPGVYYPIISILDYTLLRCPHLTTNK